VEDDIPKSEERKIPGFLYFVYVAVLAGGIWGMIAFWNGSQGWFDRGFWHELQKAAATTAPFEKRRS
jgi:hypothetical protein